MRTRLRYAGFGVLATFTGMAAGHLVSAFLDPASSPVLAVGSTVIDLTPTPAKEWAVRTFGTADKPLLVGTVTAGAALLAATGGVLARRRFAPGAGVLVALVLLAAAAATSRPGAGPLDVVPAGAAGLTGVGALALLVRLSSSRPRPTHLQPQASGEGPGRRGVLLAAGGLAVAATAMGAGGRWVARLRAAPAYVDLPAPRDPAGAFPRGLETAYDGISPFRTPTRDFYRIDTRLTLPVVDLDDYTLTIDGDVAEELEFTFEQLAAMTLMERDITLTCVSNEVGGPYVGGARWLGVRLTDLLDRAGVGSRADQILCTDVDGMTISVPLRLATDGRDAMVALGMNGAALPREHGFPVRMVVPGLYGFISACKWMTRMTLTTYAEQEAYWTERGWATDAPVKPSSRIDTPRSFSEIAAGDTFVGGVAWAQPDGVAGVEVQVDGGAWQSARLGPTAGDDYWRQWYLPWTAEPGEHRLACRATNRNGEVQTAVRATPFPNGASGLQSIVVRVT